MIKIGEMNNATESKLKCMLFGFSINVVLGYLLYMLKPFNILMYANQRQVYILTIIPVVVVITLIIHEGIHVILFKVFGKGQAKIRIKREKEVGAIVVQQMNPDVFYTKAETIIILLAPAVIITLLSIPLLSITPIASIVYINCILNTIGSSIDMYVVLRLLTSFHGDIKIQYNNGSTAGMTIYKQ